jgi:ubiquitin-like protein Pup
MKEQIRKPHPEEEHPPEQDTPVAPEADTGDLDDLLDEIDEVLEENAEEFVRNYVQKGGE